MQDLPKITLITCGYKKLNQTYSNIEHIISEDVEPYEAFNDGVQSSNSLIYGFLDQYSDFSVDDAVEQIVQKFLTYPELGGVYADNILNGYRQYYPAYSYESTQNIVIQTPFFCRRELNIKFEQSDMCYYEAIKNIGSYTILHHIPKALFKIVV